jgi:hypothetical protein
MAASRESKTYSDKLNARANERQNALIKTDKNLSKNIWFWGARNDAPIHFFEITEESPTATACLDKLDMFIQADGFIDPNSSKVKVNEFQTADDILEDISEEIAMFDDFVMHYTPFFGWKSLPYHQVREAIDKTGIIYNQYWGQKDYKQQDDLYIPYHNGKGIGFDADYQIKEYGEIRGVVWKSFRPKYNRYHYPRPNWFSAREDIIMETELMYFDLENVSNGFLPSGVLTKLAKSDNNVEDGSGNTTRSKVQDEYDAVVGRGNRGSLMIEEVNSMDEAARLTYVDAKPVFEAAIKAREEKPKHIARAFQVPPVLIGVESPGKLGSNQQLANEIDLFNSVVNRKQRKIQRFFEFAFSPEMLSLNQMQPITYNWTLSSFKPVNFIPDYILEKMTDTEIRQLAGLPEIKTENNETNNE